MGLHPINPTFHSLQQRTHSRILCQGHNSSLSMLVRAVLLDKKPDEVPVAEEQRRNPPISFHQDIIVSFHQDIISKVYRKKENTKKRENTYKTKASREEKKVSSMQVHA
ncbi:hypothetical protein L6452_34720 [Arctium lappa]|uniref:Uncharacterized protein n=1 Tax=Arctium lappa TaxID=4217 RepID=A0ACB8YJ10_ARCLA|nr:hypothetical protein L6452_34720 [Arctium lappa]